MIGVLLFMAGLWALGAAFGTPRRSRLLAMAVLWGLAGVALAVLPAGQPVRRIIGDDLRVWAALTVLAALGLGYAWLLTRLKARAVTEQPKSKLMAALREKRTRLGLVRVEVWVPKAMVERVRRYAARLANGSNAQRGDK